MAQMLDAVLSLKDDFSKSLEAAQKQAKTFQSNWNKTTKNIEKNAKKISRAGQTMTAALTVPVAGVGAAAVKTGMEFEAGMSTVQATMNASTQDMAKLEEKAKEIGSTTKLSATQAAEAFNYMAMAGWDAEKSIAGIDTVAKLAIASGEELGTVSDIVTDAMTGMGIEVTAENVEHFGNVLAATASGANTTVAGMGETFKYVAPLANTFSYSIDDLAVATGLLANAGIKGEQAGTTLRAAFTRMSTGTGEAAVWMEKMGISMYDANGNAKDLMSVMKDLRGGFASLGTEEQTAAAAAMFGQNAMSGMLALINSSDEDFDNMTNAINGSAGALDRMKATMEDNLQGDWDKLKSSAESALLTIYKTLEPTIRKMLQFASSVMTAFSGLSEGTIKMITVIALVVAAIGPLLMIIGSLMSALVNIRNGISLIMKGTTMLKAGMALLSPQILIIIAIIAALIAVGYLLYKNWDTVKAYLIYGWTVFKNTVTDVVQAIKKAFGALKDWISDKATAIKEAIASLGKRVKQVFEDKVLAPIKAVQEKFEAVKKLFEGGIPDVTTTITTKIKEIAADKNATGTSYFQGGLTTLHERGDEIYDLPRGTRIYPHSKSLDMAYQEGRNSGGGSSTVNVNFSGAVFHVREEADIEAIGRVIAQRVNLASKNRVAMA